MRMIGRRDAILPLADHARHDVTGRRVVAHVLQGVDVAFGILGQLLGGVGVRVVQIAIEAGAGAQLFTQAGSLSWEVRCPHSVHFSAHFSAAFHERTP